MPARRRGPSRVHRAGLCRDRYPRARRAGGRAHLPLVGSAPGNSRAAPRPGCEPLRPLPFKSPPGTDNRRDAAEARRRPACPPRAGRNDVLCTAESAAPPRPRDPGTCANRPTQPGRGGGTPLRLRGTGRAPPLAPAPRGVSPPPYRSVASSPHLGSRLVGAEAGAETPGRLPAGLIHDLPGAESAPPECGLRPPHGVSAPRAGFLKGKGRGVRG